MEPEENFRIIPKRKLNEAEKQIIMLKIEKMKLNRDKSILILGSGIFLFITFIIVSIIGLINGLISKNQLNLLVIGGIVVMVISIFPYLRFVLREERSLEKTINELIN